MLCTVQIDNHAVCYAGDSLRCRLTFANGGEETAATTTPSGGVSPAGLLVPPARAAAVAAAAASATASPGRAKATPAELRSLRADADAAANNPQRQAEASSFSLFGALMRRSASVASVASSTLSYITGADQGWESPPGEAGGEGEADAPAGGGTAPEASAPRAGGGDADDVTSVFASATGARGGKINSPPPGRGRKVSAASNSLPTPADGAGELSPPPRPSPPRQRESSPKCNILWCYVQVVGSFCVDPTLVKPQTLQTLNSRVMYSRSGSRYGGGGMLETIEPNRQASSSTTGTQSAADQKWLPVISLPPTLLFCDLTLRLGESRNYSYEVALPALLPPSHKGRGSSFAYHLRIGTQCGGAHDPSHTIQMPFRVFNQVGADGSLTTYDVMDPVVMYKDVAVVSCGEDAEAAAAAAAGGGGSGEATAKKGIVDAREFYRRATENQLASESPPTSPEDGPDAALPLNFRNIVALCRTAKKANYEICKNNERVAQVFLPKTVHRLGDSVTGVVDFANGVIPCYQVSITLESVESVELAFANRRKKDIELATKRVYAQRHEFCLNTRRTSFDLFIPPAATPEFRTTAVSLKWFVRFEFLTGLGDLPWLPSTFYGVRTTLHRIEDAAPAVDIEAFDCLVPIKVLPTDFIEGKKFADSKTLEL